MKRLLTPNHYPVNREGLAGWWSYRNSGSVAAFGTWKDYSGKGNHGPLIGNAYVNNNGVNLDGSDDLAICGTDLLNTYYSVLLRFMVPTGSSGGCLFSQYDYEHYTNGRFNIQVGDKFIAWEGGSGASRTISSTTVIAKDTWYMGAVTNYNKSVKLYVNGVQEATGTFLYYPPNVGNFIGTYAPIEGFFNGDIDDIQVYNRVLSDGEIQANYLKNMRG